MLADWFPPRAVRRRFMTVVPVCAGFLFSASLGAQASRKRIALVPQSPCFGALGVVSVKVVNADGTPVNDARLELRRVTGNKLVGRITSPMDDQGDYALLDDLGASGVAPLGEHFDLAVVRGTRRTVVRYLIGLRPPERCHVIMLDGDPIIRLK